MELPETLLSAVKVLTGALDILDAAVERRVQVEATRADLAQEFAIMQDDRARLGEDLEAATIDRTRLAVAASELSRRLARMERLCATLVAQPGP